MITRTFKLCLNAGTGSAPYINVSQYDEGETWLFELYSETGERYIPTTGAIVGVKSDGHGIVNTGTVDSEGRVVITETQQMTASAGRAIYELSIDGLTHGTANFIVAVERKPTDDAVMSDSDLSLIQEAIDSAEVIVEVIGDGDPSEVIGEHVDAWLDNHPEATTTVQDGAITAPKINQSLWDKLLVSEEASGNPASFDDGADDVPVSSLKVALEPIQTGSGDPSPSNVRPIIAANGKNLLPSHAVGSTTTSGVTLVTNAEGIVTANGTATGDIWFLLSAITLTGNYNLNGCPSGGTSSTYAIVSQTASGSKFDTGSGVAVTYDGTSKNVYIFIANGQTVDNLVFKPMIYRTDADSSYQPYQGIMVEQTGRNLYPIAIGRDVWGNNASGTHSTDNDVLTVTVTTASSSGVYSSGTSKFASLTPTLTGTYSYSLSAKASANGSYIIGFYGAGRETKAVTTQWQRYTFTGTFDGTGKTFNIYGTGTAGTIEIKDFMLEVGSEAHEYAPYASASYPYSLGQSVYGGTVDLATGVLTVTHEIVDMGTLTWTYDSSVPRFYTSELSNLAKRPSANIIKANILCSNYQTTSIEGSPSLFDGLDDSIALSITGTLSVRDESYTSVATFTTAMNGVQLVYELATPTTIQLTPQEVKTLIGYNNISSTGTVDVIYHADTKLYVDKMAAVDNAIIAPTEADFVATRNYTTNDLVIVNDTLYKVTSNIQNGGTITPNSNVQQTTLSALIKALS